MKDHFAPKLSHNVSVYLRIEIHILSLHWKMKNISYFNVCEALRDSRKHYNSSCFSSPSASLNMNFNPYIYILYYQSNLFYYLSPYRISYPYKMKYSMLEQPGRETHEHNVVARCE